MTERFKPVAWARQEDVTQLGDLHDGLASNIYDLEARLVVFERALSAVIEDTETIFGALGPADEPEAPDSGEADERSIVEPEPAPDASTEDEESPEQEAARLRSEAQAAFVRGNEAATPEAASDFNDVTDVPEGGRRVE